MSTDSNRPASPWSSDTAMQASAEGSPLYQQLADTLARQIQSGGVLPGDRLPTEAELGAQFGLSRITVRQALGILTSQGLIERFASRGSFVKQRTPSGGWELRSIDDLVQQGIETKTQIVSWGVVAPPQPIEDFFESGEPVFRLRAVRTQASIPIYFAENYLLASVGERLQQSDLVSRTVVDLLRNQLSVCVDKASEEIEAGLADADLAKRLWIQPGDPVLVQRIDLFDDHDAPLQTGTGWWRSDRFKRRYVFR